MSMSTVHPAATERKRIMNGCDIHSGGFAGQISIPRFGGPDAWERRCQRTPTAFRTQETVVDTFTAWVDRIQLHQLLTGKPINK